MWSKGFLWLLGVLRESTTSERGSRPASTRSLNICGTSSAFREIHDALQASLERCCAMPFPHSVPAISWDGPHAWTSDVVWRRRRDPYAGPRDPVLPMKHRQGSVAWGHPDEWQTNQVRLRSTDGSRMGIGDSLHWAPLRSSR